MVREIEKLHLKFGNLEKEIDNLHKVIATQQAAGRILLNTIKRLEGICLAMAKLIDNTATIQEKNTLREFIESYME